MFITGLVVQSYPFDVGRIVGELVQVVDLHDGVVGSHHGTVVHSRPKIEKGFTDYCHAPDAQLENITRPPNLELRG